MFSQNPCVECQVVTMSGEASMGVKSSSEIDRNISVDESVSMSIEKEEGGVVFYVPALKGRVVEGGAAMICERIEDVGKGR